MRYVYFNVQADLLSPTGIHIHWLQAPPDEIKALEDFNVTYEMNVEPEFYTWAVDPSRDLFAGAGITYVDDSNIIFHYI